MPVMTASKPTLGVPQRPMRRADTDGILGGVCAGIAIRLGVRERTVRVLFCLGAFVWGVGLLLYAGVWVFLPRSGEDLAIGKRISEHRRETHVLLISLIVVVVLLSVLNTFGLPRSGWFIWSILLSAVGLVAVWRGASPDERKHLEAFVSTAPFLGGATARGWKALFLRVIPGIVLVVLALSILERYDGRFHHHFGSVVPSIIGTGVLLVGLLVLFAPWWLRTIRELSEERAERIRVQERSSMVAHIHDSVLQTLTLIERAAGNESDVVRLARAQERELRQWLFDPDSVGSNGEPTTFAALVATIERDVENDYGVKVELVSVRDCEADERVTALVAAGREAAINAAKWSGATSVSIYAEVEPDEVSLYVRDTGRGFDQGAVANDRHGITLSIRQRMAQVSGTVKIRTSPGAGTDVQLTLPRRPA